MICACKWQMSLQVRGVRMDAQKILLLIGRDNWLQDYALNRMLLERLENRGVEIVWEDGAGKFVHYLNKLKKRYTWMPCFTKKWNIKIIQIIYGILHPGYFLTVYKKKISPIKFRSEYLIKTINQLGKKKNIYVLSKSSGARMATLLADQANLKHVICLSYPFRHPEAAEEPDRYLHLEKIKTSITIIQGDKDAYGGAEIKGKYKFSPSVELMFIDASHAFEINATQANEVVNKIEKILF
jgi:uncharacterized protein